MQENNSLTISWELLNENAIGIARGWYPVSDANSGQGSEAIHTSSYANCVWRLGMPIFAADRECLYPPPPGFSQVFILKGVKVLCFDTLLQVFILRELSAQKWCNLPGLAEARNLNELELLAAGGLVRDNTLNHTTYLDVCQ